MSISHSGRGCRAARASGKQLAPAFHGRAFREQLADRRQRRARIGHDADRGRVVDADLVGVEVDLDELPGHGHAPPVGENLGEPAADGKHGVGVGQGGPRRAERAWPSEQGSRSSSSPLAFSVVMTGQRSWRASCLISSPAPAQSAPPPARMIGRRAAASTAAASATPSSGTPGSLAGANPSRSAATVQGSRIRSWGRKSAAGLGRVVVIAWNAWPTIAGICSLLRTVPHHFVTGRKIASRSIS